MNKDKMIEDVRSNVKKEITEAVKKVISETVDFTTIIQGSPPKLPNMSDGVSEFTNVIPESTGLPL